MLVKHGENWETHYNQPSVCVGRVASVSASSVIMQHNSDSNSNKCGKGRAKKAVNSAEKSYMSTLMTICCSAVAVAALATTVAHLARLQQEQTGDSGRNKLTESSQSTSYWLLQRRLIVIFPWCRCLAAWKQLLPMLPPLCCSNHPVEYCLCCHCFFPVALLRHVM